MSTFVQRIEKKIKRIEIQLLYNLRLDLEQPSKLLGVSSYLSILFADVHFSWNF